MKEIKEDLTIWKYVPYSWIRRFSNIKMAILTQMISRLEAILIEIPAICFAEIGKLVLKFHMKMQGTQNSQNNLKKEEQSWRTHTSGFQKLIHSYSTQGSMELA